MAERHCPKRLYCFTISAEERENAQEFEDIIFPRIDNTHAVVNCAYYSMKKRVTITLDPEVHNRAKRVARTRKTTFSGLVESCLKESSREAEAKNGGTLVDEMIGSASLREPPKESDPLFDALRDKYVAESGA